MLLLWFFMHHLLHIFLNTQRILKNDRVSNSSSKSATFVEKNFPGKFCPVSGFLLKWPYFVVFHIRPFYYNWNMYLNAIFCSRTSKSGFLPKIRFSKTSFFKFMHVKNFFGYFLSLIGKTLLCSIIALKRIFRLVDFLLSSD